LIPFDNTYARLPARFFDLSQPKRVFAPELVMLNEELAGELRIDPAWLRSAEGVAVLAGNEVPAGAEPLSQAYAGHQFGGWVPQLGDGRAILLGEVVDLKGQRRDIQLKGSGRTAFSRRGDGRATLGSTVREYLVSEAMTALGVPSTRALAVIATGENVPRPELHPGGIFTRVAASHIRVGTFQYLFGKQDKDGIRALADYAIGRHYPEVSTLEGPERYLEFFRRVCTAQATLIARWMHLGFIHGVMNTDNMTISGETIDYGPCAFMEAFHPDTVFSSIDRGGRYAWRNQPGIAQWNLARLGETLAPLVDDHMDTALKRMDETLAGFEETFGEAFINGFGIKLGLDEMNDSARGHLNATLRLMAENKVDFTLFFRHLTRLAGGELDDQGFATALGQPPGITAWTSSWHQTAGPVSKERLQLMRERNPIFIPRNHRVEQAIQAAEAGDYAPFRRFAKAWNSPYAEQSEHADLELPAKPHEAVCETFCGT